MINERKNINKTSISVEYSYQLPSSNDSKYIQLHQKELHSQMQNYHYQQLN